MKEERFSMEQLAAAARKQIKTEVGPQPAVSHEPLACVLADYCAAKGIDQGELAKRLHISEGSLRRLALVTCDVLALITVLQGAA